jgi:hypothetical protein
MFLTRVLFGAQVYRLQSVSAAQLPTWHITRPSVLLTVATSWPTAHSTSLRATDSGHFLTDSTQHVPACCWQWPLPDRQHTARPCVLLTVATSWPTAHSTSLRATDSGHFLTDRSHSQLVTVMSGVPVVITPTETWGAAPCCSPSISPTIWHLSGPQSWDAACVSQYNNTSCFSYCSQI